MEDPSILQFFRPQGLFPAVVVLGVAWFLARLTEGAFERAGTRFTEYRLTLNQTKAIIRLVLWLGGMAAAISLVFQLSDEALLALGGFVLRALFLDGLRRRGVFRHHRLERGELFAAELAGGVAIGRARRCLFCNFCLFVCFLVRWCFVVGACVL